MAKPIQPPKDLSQSAREWWRKLQTEYEVNDAGGLALLEQAARCYDRAEAAHAVLKKEGTVIRDRFGQPRAHPVTLTERDARAGMLAALRALNFDALPAEPRVGRPNGR